jgi:hypothetical protein
MRSYIMSLSLLLSLFCLYTVLVLANKHTADAPASTASVDDLSADTGRAPASTTTELN